MFNRNHTEQKEGNNTKKKTWKSRLMSLLLSVTIAGSAFAGMPAKEVQAASTLHWPVPNHTQLSQGLHGNAIDISDGSIGGAKVVAAMGGKITHIYLCGSQHYGSYHNCNGFGTGVVVAGNDGRTYQYAHMQANSIPSNVYYGATVYAGQQLGRVGTTGNSTGNHLHFGISIGNYWNNSGINPAYETYINKTISTQPAKKYNVTFSGLKTTSVSQTNANVYAKVNNPGKYKISSIGMFLWDSKGKLIVNSGKYCNYNYAAFGQQFNIYSLAKKTLKAGSTYKYQFWLKANNKYYYSSTAKFTTKKATVTLSRGSITKLTSPKKRYMYVYWKKDANATGYQIQYATNCLFTNYRLGYTLNKNQTSGAIKTPSNYSKRYCYVRVRSIRKEGSKYRYGSWSTVKYVKVK